MPYTNNVVLMGHAVKTPEMRETPNGKKVCNFSIAIKTGKEHTSFIELCCWEKTAEIAAESIVKGCLMSVEGKLIQNSYETDGQKRSKTYVNVYRVNFLRNAGEGKQNPESKETKKKSGEELIF